MRKCFNKSINNITCCLRLNSIHRHLGSHALISRLCISVFFSCAFSGFFRRLFLSLIFNSTKSTRQWGTAYFNSAKVDPISIGTILIDKIVFARFAHLDLSILHSSKAPTRRHDFSARRVADEVFFRIRILLLDCIFCLLLCAFCPKTGSNSWTLLVAQKKNLLLTGTSWLSGLSVLSQYSKLRKL